MYEITHIYEFVEIFLREVSSLKGFYAYAKSRAIHMTQLEWNENW